MRRFALALTWAFTRWAVAPSLQICKLQLSEESPHAVWHWFLPFFTRLHKLSSIHRYSPRHLYQQNSSQAMPPKGTSTRAKRKKMVVDDSTASPNDEPQPRKSARKSKPSEAAK